MIQAAALDRFARQVRPQKSPLAGVSDVAWDTFTRALSTQPIAAVSQAGGLGSFNLRPRRLGEIGVMTNLRRDAAGRWVGDFVAPYDRESFLRDAYLQDKVFRQSVVAHDAELGGFACPEGVSRSGCLGILHCGGQGALEAWPEGAFRTTKVILDRVNHLF